MKHSPIAGFGLGLRPEHYAEIDGASPRLQWLEIISENYMGLGGRPLHHLERIRADYPMVMHGVSLSIGSCDPLDLAYLQQLKTLAARIEAAYITDHLCFTGVDHTNLHDLLPLPLHEATLKHLVERIGRVQDLLGQRIALENVSSYVRFADDDLTEWAFIAELCRRADCDLLLDVNNVFVNAVNHGFDARQFIDGLPGERIRHIHLAGHEDHGSYRIDTHDHDVCSEVWALYRYTLERFGPMATMIERDDHIPPLDRLLQELDGARRITAEVERARARHAA